MKTKLLLISLLTSMILQAALPDWTVNINSLPDSASVTPVKSIVDRFENNIVLGLYNLPLPSGTAVQKVVLNKIDKTGVIIWSYTFDNNGIDQPRGVDMALDNDDNIYVAGGLMETPTWQPLLSRSTPPAACYGKERVHRISTPGVTRKSSSGMILYICRVQLASRCMM